MDGVEYTDTAVTQDITATCNSGVLELSGGITDTDGLSTIGCDNVNESKKVRIRDGTKWEGENWSWKIGRKIVGE